MWYVAEKTDEVASISTKSRLALVVDIGDPARHLDAAIGSERAVHDDSLQARSDLVES